MKWIRAIMSEISQKDIERIELLEIVASTKTGLKMLSSEQLNRLYQLVNEKVYTNEIHIAKSKKDLLEKINNRIYDLGEGRIIL